MTDPAAWVVDGYDVHLLFEKHEEEAARALFRSFLHYVEAEQIPYERGIVFPAPVGPWPTPMWQILLRRKERTLLERDLGRCIAWMMLNRGSFSAMVHPNTREEAGIGGGLRDHRDYCLWLGEPRRLRLGIFG